MSSSTSQQNKSNTEIYIKPIQSYQEFEQYSKFYYDNFYMTHLENYKDILYMNTLDLEELINKEILKMPIYDFKDIQFNTKYPIKLFNKQNNELIGTGCWYTYLIPDQKIINTFDFSKIPDEEKFDRLNELDYMLLSKLSLKEQLEGWYIDNLTLNKKYLTTGLYKRITLEAMKYMFNLNKEKVFDKKYVYLIIANEPRLLDSMKKIGFEIITKEEYSVKLSNGKEKKEMWFLLRKRISKEYKTKF